VDDQGSIPGRDRDFSLCHCIRTSSGAHPIKLELGALSSGVKQLGSEANLSPSSSIKVKNTWSYTSTPPASFMAWYLIKHRIYPYGVVLS
jgi:hypothetical protein